MTELERVEVGPRRAYVTEDEVVYEHNGWVRSTRKVLPASKVTSVTVDERGSWTLLILGILATWPALGGLIAIVVQEDSASWILLGTVATAFVGLACLALFLLLRFVRIRVTSANASFTLPGRGLHSSELKELARATLRVAALHEPARQATPKQGREKPRSTPG